MTATATNPETPAMPKKKAPRPNEKKLALPGHRGANVIWVKPSELTIIAEKGHPLYDPRVEADLSPEFVKNVEEEGVQVPILVAKLEAGGSKANVVIDGKQRTRAGLEIAKRDPSFEIPCLLVKGDDRALFSLMVLTNENRRDDTPTDKARKVERFMQLYLEAAATDKEAKKATPAALQKQAVQEAALVFGVTEKTIQGRQKLLQTAPAVQKAVEEGRIGWWAASEFAGLPAEEQEAAVEEVIAEAGKGGKKPTVEGAKRKAGKGDSKRREKLAQLTQDLKDAAEEFGAASEDGSGLREAGEKLKDAARAYYKLVSTPTKAEKEKASSKA